MGNTVKDFGEVKQYGVNLLLVIQSSCQVIDGKNELGLTYSALSKAVLTASKDVVSLKVELLGIRIGKWILVLHQLQS